MEDKNQYNTNTFPDNDVIVIGAGASGLAVAQALRERGLSARILEKTKRAGDAWYHRHPQLRLNTHRDLSKLPGKSIPKSAGAFPSRDNIIKYLDSYAKSLDVPIDYNVNVNAIDRHSSGNSAQDDSRTAFRNAWTVETDNGKYKARHVIVATGLDRKPYVPPWNGLECYRNKIIHSANFGDVEQYRGKNILLVGAGNSGSDILNHLSTVETKNLWVSVRHGPVIFPKWLCGIPVQRLSPILATLPVTIVDKLLGLMEYLAFGNLKKWGLHKHPLGGATRLLQSGIAPAIDDGFIARLKTGKISVVPKIQKFNPKNVQLINLQEIEPDIVIVATGYRTGLESMLGHLSVLNDLGVPIINGAEQCESTPGLWFTGMRAQLPGFFHMAGNIGKEIAEAIAVQQRKDSAKSTPDFHLSEAET